MRALHVAVTLLLAMMVNSQETTQKFQADRFLDMLGKTFDPSVAYRDLLSALRKRMDVANGTAATPSGMATADSGATNPNAVADSTPNCPPVPPKPGTTVSYNSDTRIKGSRAFYQCDKGYQGRSLFLLCQDGGQWTDASMYMGCTKVDCGSPPPSVPNATPAYTATTYGAIVLYSCENGYKASAPDANVTCQENGQWSKPGFQCDKIVSSVPNALTPANLAALAPMFGSAASSGQGANNPQNAMMSAMMKAMAGMGSSGGSGFPSMNQPTQSTSSASSSAPTNNQEMVAMIAKMFPGFAPPAPPPTTTTPAPVVHQNPMMGNAGGFQLPSHLQSLLPNGISSPKGMNPQDLMTLASIGLGSNNAAAAPRGISQLLGTMNPMSLLGQTMGMGSGAGAGHSGATPGVPADPEKVAEQREEMMMRAMMATAMKSMMSPQGRPQSQNNTMSGGNNGQRANPAMDMMALMALSGGLSGQGGGGSGGGGSGGMDPMAMLGGMSPSMLGLGGMGMGGGGGGAGLFGDLFGSA